MTSNGVLHRPCCPRALKLLSCRAIHPRTHHTLSHRHTKDGIAQGLQPAHLEMVGIGFGHALVLSRKSADAASLFNNSCSAAECDRLSFRALNLEDIGPVRKSLEVADVRVGSRIEVDHVCSAPDSGHRPALLLQFIPGSRVGRNSSHGGNSKWEIP
jgi:hypothetical protein